MGDVIVITSGKGGVGKTTCTANLGFGLAKQGFRVVLVDMDQGLRNLDVVLGLEKELTFHLQDVLMHRCRLRQALIRDRRQSGLHLLPAASFLAEEGAFGEELRLLTLELKEQFDYVLLDCPAGIGKGFEDCIMSADRAILVTEPEVSAIRDADKVLTILQEKQFQQTELLVNRVHIKLVKKGFMLSPEDVQEVLAVPLLGVIPEDEEVLIALSDGEPVINFSSDSGACFENICKRLIGMNVPIGISYAKYGGFLRACSLFFR